MSLAVVVSLAGLSVPVNATVVVIALWVDVLRHHVYESHHPTNKGGNEGGDCGVGC